MVFVLLYYVCVFPTVRRFSTVGERNPHISTAHLHSLVNEVREVNDIFENVSSGRSHLYNCFQSKEIVLTFCHSTRSKVISFVLFQGHLVLL